MRFNHADFSAIVTGESESRSKKRNNHDLPDAIHTTDVTTPVIADLSSVDLVVSLHGCGGLRLFHGGLNVNIDWLNNSSDFKTVIWR